jgi:hypothetical protein
VVLCSYPTIFCLRLLRSLQHVSRRVLAVVAVYVGVALVGFNPQRWDAVVFDLPRGGHGIHLRDLIGVGLITLGVVVLWRSGRAAAVDGA